MQNTHQFLTNQKSCISVIVSFKFLYNHNKYAEEISSKFCMPFKITSSNMVTLNMTKDNFMILENYGIVLCDT